MFPYQQTRARWYAVPAVFFSVLSGVARQMHLPLLPGLFWFIAAAFSVAACYYLAVAKGRDSFFCLLGLLTFLGLIIATLLRDSHPESSHDDDAPTDAGPDTSRPTSTA